MFVWFTEVSVCVLTCDVIDPVAMVDGGPEGEGAAIAHAHNVFEQFRATVLHRKTNVLRRPLQICTSSFEGKILERLSFTLARFALE